MEEKNKEFTLAQEHAAPPPECAALPPEVLPPDTVLPGEASAAESAAALKKKPAKWKKIAIMLGGLSAMTAVAVTGGGTAEDPVPATPDTPPVQQEPYVPPEPEPERERAASLEMGKCVEGLILPRFSGAGLQTGAQKMRRPRRKAPGRVEIRGANA